MDLKEFSKSELVSVLELIEKARKCSSIEELRKLVLDTSDLMEAEYAICGLARVNGLKVSEAVTIINGSYPDEWEQVYRKERLYLKDPIVKYHTRYSTSCLWRDMPPESADTASKETLDFAYDFGIRFGISTSIYIPEYSNISIFAFSGHKDTFTDHQKKLAELLSLHLNGALVKTTYDIPALEIKLPDDIKALTDRLNPFIGGPNGV